MCSSVINKQKQRETLPVINSRGQRRLKKKLTLCTGIIVLHSGNNLRFGSQLYAETKPSGGGEQNNRISLKYGLLPQELGSLCARAKQNPPTVRNRNLVIKMSDEHT